MDEPSFPGVEEVKPIPSDMILKSKRLQQQQKKQQQSNLNQQQQQQQIELDEDGNLLEEQEGDEEHEEDDGDEEIGVVGNDKKQLDKIAEAKRLDNKRKRQEKKQKQKQAKINTSVWVTGLPPGTSIEDIARYFSKCGLIKKDPETAQFKIKIYNSVAATPLSTVDALITFFRPESIELAVTLLDETEIQPKFKIRVEEAKWDKTQAHKMNESSGSVGDKKQQPKKSRPSKKQKLYNQEKELGWEEDDNRHVIVKHVFTQEEAWSDANFFKELEEELQTECEKFGGVDKIKFFEYNPEGVVAIKFSDHGGAERFIEKSNGRFFGGRKLEAFFYDGFANYFVEETEEQKKKRLAAFEQWIDDS